MSRRIVFKVGEHTSSQSHVRIPFDITNLSHSSTFCVTEKISS